jgi:hypothetical protein
MRVYVFGYLSSGKWAGITKSKTGRAGGRYAGIAMENNL